MVMHSNLLQSNSAQESNQMYFPKCYCQLLVTFNTCTQLNIIAKNHRLLYYFYYICMATVSPS